MLIKLLKKGIHSLDELQSMQPILRSLGEIVRWLEKDTLIRDAADIYDRPKYGQFHQSSKWWWKNFIFSYLIGEFVNFIFSYLIGEFAF